MYSKSCVVHTVLTHRCATSQAPPFVDDDYRPPGSAPYQSAPKPYGSAPNQYPTTSRCSSHTLAPRHPPPHGLVPPQAFPPPQQAFPAPQRAPTHPYPAQTSYASPFQTQPPAPARWVKSDSGKTGNSSVGESYNNANTRADYRANTQVEAHTSNAPTVVFQNIFSASCLWFHKYACRS